MALDYKFSLERHQLQLLVLKFWKKKSSHTFHVFFISTQLIYSVFDSECMFDDCACVCVSANSVLLIVICFMHENVCSVWAFFIHST